MKPIFPCFWMICFIIFMHITANAQQLTQPFLLGKKENIVMQKNFPVLWILSQQKECLLTVTQDNELKQLGNKAFENLKNTYDFSQDKYNVYNAILISQEQISLIQKRILYYYKLKKDIYYAIHNWINSNQLSKNNSEDSVLYVELNKELNGINNIIEVYGKSKKPPYNNIDSISGQIANDSKYVQNLLLTQLRNEIFIPALFFNVPLKASLILLDVNGRMNAADYEPMEKTVNLAAVNLVQKIDWKAYPYSHIMIPGAGPEIKDDSISPGSILRCRLAALLYFQKLAPFIVPSGGRVHPYKTNYSEAEEMKKYLISELGVPASAIIMEPHARHTTTNVRNTVRLLYQYKIPFDKKGIISTTEDQMSSMRSTGFLKRCQDEMGCIPYKLGKEISNTASEYIPLLTALLIEPKDPLDP